MMNSNILKRNIGLTFEEQPDGKAHKAMIRVWAPDASSVTLKLADAEIGLKQEAHGYWHLETEEVKTGDKYWLLIDAERKLPDPASLCQPEGVHGPSEAISLAYGWDEGSWKNIPLKDYIIYELHTGTFSDSGDFDGIAAHLDHLLELGITAVELMPVAAFPGTRNWGYDGVFPFAVQSSYGGAEGLQKLVSLCHQRGLAVILDVVYNHLGPEGNYLEAFGPYFTEKYKTPWGHAINFDDRNCDGVRAYFIENVLMWFRDFHIDALRLDAVHAIKDFSAKHILQEIREQVDVLMQETGKVHYLIAESDLNDPRYICPAGQNGMGMDSQWADEFHHALRVTAGEAKMGYYSDFHGVDDLAKSFANAYVYTGQYSEERGKKFGRPSVGHPGEQFIVFSQNHDQVGNRMLGERSSTLMSFEMQKLMAGAVLMSPFLPMLFMGEEWAEPNPFLYFIDHGDEQLVEQVRKGRAEEFAALHGQGTAPDPKSEDTFNSSGLNWQLPAGPESRHTVMLRFYKYMIHLRKTQPILSGCDRDLLKAETFADDNCLIIHRGRSGAAERIICLMNFSAEMRQILIPGGLKAARKLADSASPEWLGPGAAPDTIYHQHSDIADFKLTVQPQSFIIYTATYV